MCYAAPTGHGGPEGSRRYDYVTLKRGQDTFIYMDVGFWGGADKRTFGVVCGPHVWLCDYSQGGSAPEPTDVSSNELYAFHKAMGGFKVTTHATLPMEKSDPWGDGSAKIYLILPDMHMWPEPEVLKYRRKDFFEPEELKALDGGIKDGTLIRDSTGSLDIPIEKGESYEEHSLRMFTTPQGRAAMKENALTDVKKMKEEEDKHAFGSTAGKDLVKLLKALQQARTSPDNPFDVTLLHVGDLLEMWAPYHTWSGSKPFVYEDSLKLSATANERVPKWIDLAYGYTHNQPALFALKDAACRQIYGNHDVYLAFDKWKPKNVAIMDHLRNAPGFFSENLLWVEHGHRFDPSNRDGYWLWIDLDHPPGALINTAVNYYPFLRILGDKYDNPDKNLYTKNVPYATIWYLLASYAGLPKAGGFRQPPRFRIFCQGHTHCPILLKVNVAWSRLEGNYTGTAVEEEIMKEEQRREKGARDGSYDPVTTEEFIIYMEQRREQRVREQRKSSSR